MNKKTYFITMLVLIMLILITFYLYIKFYDCTISSTVLANIFGGLITGFIILLVGNIKNKILFNNIEISSILEEIGNKYLAGIVDGIGRRKIEIKDVIERV